MGKRTTPPPGAAQEPGEKRAVPGSLAAPGPRLCDMAILGLRDEGWAVLAPRTFTRQNLRWQPGPWPAVVYLRTRLRPLTTHFLAPADCQPTSQGTTRVFFREESCSQDRESWGRPWTPSSPFSASGLAGAHSSTVYAPCGLLLILQSGRKLDAPAPPCDIQLRAAVAQGTAGGSSESRRVAWAASGIMLPGPGLALLLMSSVTRLRWHSISIC